MQCFDAFCRQPVAITPEFDIALLTDHRSNFAGVIHRRGAYAKIVTENMVGRVIFYTVSQMPGCDIADIKIAVTVAVEYYRRFYILGGIVDRQLFAADGQQLDIADGSTYTYMSLRTK